MAMPPSPTAAAAAFHRAGTHIAGGEDRRAAGFERIRRAIGAFPIRRVDDEGPVLMKPRSSRSISGGSQSCMVSRRSWRRRRRFRSVRRSPVWVFSTSTSSRRIFAGHFADLGVIKNLDVCRRSRRDSTGSSTCFWKGRRRESRAVLSARTSERNIAACPAEFPPRNDHRRAVAELRFHRGGGVKYAQTFEASRGLRPRSDCIGRPWK